MRLNVCCLCRAIRLHLRLGVRGDLGKDARGIQRHRVLGACDHLNGVDGVVGHWTGGGVGLTLRRGERAGPFLRPRLGARVGPVTQGCRCIRGCRWRSSRNLSGRHQKLSIHSLNSFLKYAPFGKRIKSQPKKYLSVYRKRSHPFTANACFTPSSSAGP